MCAGQFGVVGIHSGCANGHIDGAGVALGVTVRRADYDRRRAARVAAGPEKLERENENTLAETLAAGLRADGFAVDVAGDGVGALERVQATGYEAIVLDIMLPGPCGYEVVRRLRGAGVWTRF